MAVQGWVFSSLRLIGSVASLREYAVEDSIVEG